MAVLMTAAPSATEEVFTTAFPPAKKSTIQRGSENANMHNGQTFDNLINNFLCSGSIEVIHHHISPPRREQQRVAVTY